MRTKPLWLLYASTLFSCMGLFIPFVHLAPYARDVGLSAATGVLLVGLIGIGSLVGRFGIAGVGDRFGRAQLLAIAYGGMGVMFALWLGSTSAPALGVFALLFGTFYGTMVALAPALVMDLFGARSIAGILGFVYTAAGIGNLIGPAFAGYAFDLSGSYTLPIAAGIGFNASAVVAALALARAGRSRSA